MTIYAITLTRFKYDKKILNTELIYVQLLYLHGFTNSIFNSKNILNIKKNFTVNTHKNKFLSLPFKQIIIERTKRARPIQCGYSKSGTLAPGFKNALAWKQHE